MSDLQAFFAENSANEVIEEFVVSERFKDSEGNPIAWKLRTMTECENEEIRRASTRTVKGKNGSKSFETNAEEYLGKLVVSSVVYPDLKNAALQKSYEVMGADALVKRMLLAGEYAALVQKVQEINGFDRDINETSEEIKNG